MRVAIYARVSTTNGQSPEMQLSDLQEYASRRGWEVFAEYVDNGVSGADSALIPMLGRPPVELSAICVGTVALCSLFQRLSREHLLGERCGEGSTNLHLIGANEFARLGTTKWGDIA
jgi:Resolvase, N terminal domain